MKDSLVTLNIHDWVIKLRLPSGGVSYSPFLLLHGWTGNENSMWVFAGRLPKEAPLIAPRGLYGASAGGYGWHSDKVHGWPAVSDFLPAVDALNELLTADNFPMLNNSKPEDFRSGLQRLHLVGFSQGAALAFAFGLTYPWRVRSIAALSGFLPEETVALAKDQPFVGKPVFLAHGTLDELVPVERARQAVAFLEQAGARVVYCEDHVGHKLSASCFRSLELFYQKIALD